MYTGFPYVKDSIFAFEAEMRTRIQSSPMKLSGYHVENIVLGELIRFVYVWGLLLRYAIPKIEQLPGWERLLKSNCVDIQYGEYYDRTSIAYKYDTRVRDIKAVKDALREKKPMHYKSYKNLNLSAEDYSNSDLVYTDFSGSNLKGSKFVDSNLVGTSWRNCNLDDVDFSGANLRRTDFRGASLNNTIFDNATITDMFL